MKRRFDKLRLVTRDDNLEVWRQERLNLRHALLDAVDDGDGVRARLLADAERDGRHAVERGRRLRVNAAVFDAAHVADLDRIAISRRDNDGVKIFYLRDARERAERHRASAFIQATAGEFEVLCAEGV